MSDTRRTPIRLTMSMTLDGFVTGPDDRHGQGLGRGGGRIFDWLDDRHGAGVAQALLAARQLDEIEIHLVPVLLGAGRRLFPDDGVGPVELELTRRLEGRGVTHLRYAVRYP